jgi:hypothetical protein
VREGACERDLDVLLLLIDAPESLSVNVLQIPRERNRGDRVQRRWVSRFCRLPFHGCWKLGRRILSRFLVARTLLHLARMSGRSVGWGRGKCRRTCRISICVRRRERFVLATTVSRPICGREKIEYRDL